MWPKKADGRKPRGRRGEDEAASALTRRGLTIVDRNVRSRLGEIDLIARDGQTLVFVEVKSRRGSGGDPPEAAVTPEKQRRLARLALGYLKMKRLGDVPCRFDVVAVTFDDQDRVSEIRHLPGAFSADE
jgi:putative endonuclease